jgi:hypothetical protein
LAQRAIFRAMPGKAQCRAKIRIPLQAKLAHTTWNSRVNRHTLPAPLTAFDHPGKLVAEDEWLLELRVSDACL